MATSDRREYLTATVLDQDFLDRCQDNLENRLEMVAHIEKPTVGIIRASDRNKYVGTFFYEALTVFPVISRTLGEWLNPSLEFSSLEILLSNVTGYFNNLLPAGADFGGWIGKDVIVYVGLRDVLSTYIELYRGRVTEVGGFSRDRSQVKVLTRDDLARTNITFPTTVFTRSVFPDIESSYIGVTIPVIYGDWTVNLRYDAAIPAFPVNGLAAGVQAGTDPVDFVISENDNVSIDSSHIYLKRGEEYFQFNSSDITVDTGNRTFSIDQDGVTQIEGNPWIYSGGDFFYVRMKGKDLGAYDDNIVWQARDILTAIIGISPADLSSLWASYRDKSTPAESAIASFKSRIWVGEPREAIEYVLQLLEQVRLEMYINRDYEFTLNSLHLDDFPALSSIDFTVKNWDLEDATFDPVLDDRNIWNRANADYAFDPNSNENAFQTAIYKNQDAINQAGKAISKKVIFPNLYEEDTVILQLKELLKLATGYPEHINITLTQRAILKDLGDWVKVDVKIGSCVYDNVPAMIRDIGYDPAGMKIPVKLWSFQMTPYPNYAPGYAGTVGGYTANIIEE